MTAGYVAEHALTDLAFALEEMVSEAAVSEGFWIVTVSPKSSEVEDLKFLLSSLGAEDGSRRKLRTSTRARSAEVRGTRTPEPRVQLGSHRSARIFSHGKLRPRVQAGSCLADGGQLVPVCLAASVSSSRNIRSAYTRQARTTGAPS